MDDRDGPVDARNPKLSVKGGTKNPKVTLIVRDICANNVDGITRRDERERLRLRRPAGRRFARDRLLRDLHRGGLTIRKGKTVTLTVEPNTKKGIGETHTVTIVGT